MSRHSPFLQLVAKPLEVKDEILSSLVRQFVRAGGTVTLTEWLNMTGKDRVALAEEREELLNEIIGSIIGGEPITDDDEEAAADEIADAVVDTVVESRGGASE